MGEILPDIENHNGKFLLNMAGQIGTAVAHARELHMFPQRDWTGLLHALERTLQQSRKDA